MGSRQGSPINSLKAAVFFDRDGVLNDLLFDEEAGILESPFSPKQFRLKRGVAQVISKINGLGLKSILVSNQPGIGMGRFSVRTLEKITAKMVRELRKSGAFFDGIYYCFHHPEKGLGKYKRNCSCRKPKAGLLFRAARDHGIDLRRSFMVGDSIFDVQAGRRAGCKTFLLAHLKCDLCDLMRRRGIKPHYLVKDLSAVVTQIVRLTKKKRSLKKVFPAVASE